MTDDDIKITALRYAMLPVLRAFFEREGSNDDALRLAVSAIEQAIAVALEPPRSWRVRETLGE